MESGVGLCLRGAPRGGQHGAPRTSPPSLPRGSTWNAGGNEALCRGNQGLPGLARHHSGLGAEFWPCTMDHEATRNPQTPEKSKRKRLEPECVSKMLLELICQCRFPRFISRTF